MSRKCFVAGCSTGYTREREKNKKAQKRNPTLFRAPRNWDLFQIWRQVIPRADRKLSVTDCVCELHFPEEDVIKYYETKCYDGEVFKLERGYPILKACAIPVIFPNLPKYSRNLKKTVQRIKPTIDRPLTRGQLKVHLAIAKEVETYFMRKLRTEKKQTVNPERTDSEIDKSIADENVNINVEATSVSAEDTSVSAEDTSVSAEDTSVSAEDTNIYAEDTNIYAEDTNIYAEDTNINAGDSTISAEGINIGAGDVNVTEVDEITFDVLVRNLESISKPSSSWAISAHNDFVVCAKWNGDYMPEKRVIIDTDLNIKVYLKDKEDARYKNVVVSNISDVSTILHLIDF